MQKHFNNNSEYYVLAITVNTKILFTRASEINLLKCLLAEILKQKVCLHNNHLKCKFSALLFQLPSKQMFPNLSYK